MTGLVAWVHERAHGIHTAPDDHLCSPHRAIDDGRGCGSRHRRLRPGECRQETLSRDDYQCVANIIDPQAGPCRDRWGVVGPVAATDLEMDYVRLGHHAPRHRDPRDHLMLCPGHHQGTGAQAGYKWATSHRSDERAYLDRRDSQVD